MVSYKPVMLNLFQHPLCKVTRSSLVLRDADMHRHDGFESSELDRPVTHSVMLNLFQHPSCKVVNLS